MHKKVTHILTTAGWTPERRVDAQAQRQCLTAEGYQVGPAVVGLLEEFGSLELEGARARLRVDACAAVRQTWRSSLRYWSARIGAEVFPVGVVDGHATLVCSNDLRTYVGFGEDLVAIGLWPDEALGALLHDGSRSAVPLLLGRAEQDFVRDDDP